MSENTYQNVNKIIYISTDAHTDCVICNSDTFHEDDFQGAVNHYVGVHGFAILHIGQETSSTNAGLSHRTVAIVGKQL